ncbi:MAG: hypothetical protein A3B04_02215 [Candidatus Portnoybacteria bacterium RIFCSPLOWO2_02_FULL_39_11]|uniref:tRNA-guanine(15) transglycosylase-like domain-containing protein n=1 Tax=Candidatus Portnoybacteria bacterium RIFCSPLOWO2_02_FULL_39_11 TaxID=1802001 RepID=A0A1G2FSX1_9BACT|nr:MAG: hypothetical protein A3B04_02215 [Candidatus Portnoybacteria bacterium RIFCSPLOWO2_02_FULL_39_11]
MWLRPGTEIIKKAGDLHGFMNWPGPILTDSGGYQVFSLGEKIRSAGVFQKHKIFPGEENFIRQASSLSAEGGTVPARRSERFDKTPASLQSGSLVKISDAGVEFRDPIDGKKYFLTPEKSIDIQLALGSDIIMVLDECPPYPASREQMEQAVTRTTAWARRCKEYFDSYIRRHPDPAVEGEGSPANAGRTFVRDSSLRSAEFTPMAIGAQNDKIKINRPLLFGIIQGGIYKDLRERSVKELLEIGFDGYAIGGVAVGEPRRYLSKVLGAVMPLLPKDKPRYLMGLGKPEEIVAAVNSGIDMFDCVIPTREARHGKLYRSKSYKLSAKSSFYETLQITNAKFAKDFSTIDKNCACYTCQNYSRAYLHHLFKVGEPLSLRLATIHNLKFYLGLMEELRKM